MLNISDADISFQIDNLNVKVIRINYGVFYAPFPSHRHGNTFYEAHLVCGGKGTLIADGVDYPLFEGVLYMTGPGVTHEQITDASDPMDEYCLQFELSERKGKCSRTTELIKNTRFWLGNDTQNTRLIFELLTLEDEKRKIGFAKSVANLTSQLLILLARSYSGSEEAGEYAKITPDDKRMVIADDSFLYDFSSITLDELSRRLNLSRRQTQRFLKKAYGKTFIELRTEARRGYAEKLISNGVSPAEAANAAGYAGVKSLKKDGGLK